MRLSLVVGTASLAVVAGMLTVPDLPGTSSASAATDEVAGIETIGPIPTVSGKGAAVPSLPPSVAVMPRGSLNSARDPWIYDARFVDVASAAARVVYLSSGRDDVVVTGELRKGWMQVTEPLVEGGDYEVSVQLDSGAWQRIGTFSVATRGGGLGPTANVGGMSVSAVTGEVSWSWASESLAGPDGGLSATLSWSTGSANSPGLPAGWQLGLSSGSPWAALSETGPSTKPLKVPAAPVARRLGKQRAGISYHYDAHVNVVVQCRGREGRWHLVKRLSAADATIEATVPKGPVWVRLGVKAGGTILWSRSTRVTRGQLVQTNRSTPLPTAGPNSLLTAGAAPSVVTLTGWDGSLLTFVRNELGVYEQANGTAVAGYTNALTRVSDGVWEFADTQGTVTRFVDGRPVSVTSQGITAVTMTWDAAGRLASASNRVGRTMTFTYAGSGSCPDWTADGFDAAPAGMLCRIAYPGDVDTEFGYSDGYLALIKDPGNQGTGLGWDTLGRLVSTRSSLVSRVATREPAAKDVLSRVEYDSQGRAYALVDQPAEVGAASARREITFPAVSEQVVKDFIANGGSGVTASVRLANTAPYRLAMTYELNPQEWTTISARDAGGLSKSTEVDPKTGRLAQTLDEQGRAYRYEYDDRGLVTTTKGPFLGGQGARAAGDGIVTTSEYDTRRVNGQDQALVGLRAQVYSKVQFGGDVASEFWAAKPSDGGLSGAWAGRPADFSVQAAGVWVPSDTEDVLGANQGWQFRLSASTDAEVTFVIGGSVCLVNVICTVKGLPKGPKSVSIQIARAASSGFFAVEAAPMGMVLHSIPTAEVGPGYALVSNQTTNDILVGKESQTRYDYADPASGRPSQVVAPGNLVTSFGYEANRSGRLITRTTPGGSVQTTDYWPLSGHATLPSPCTGTAVAAGLPRSITRPDGVKLTQYQDIRGRLIASVNGTGADAEITCISYRADSSVLSTSIYGPGGLIESTTSDEAFDGDPRVGAVTTTHGDAAPVDPGGSVTSSVRVNLLGQAVLSVDMSGTTTQTTYDNLGNATRVVQTSSTGQSITFEYAYRAVDGLLASQKVNGVVAATMAYDGTTGRLTSITYPDGVRSSYSYFGSGALNGVTVTTGDERFTRISQTLGRAAAGRIESQSLTVRGTAATTENRVYTYDASGRLTRTVITTDGKRSTFGYRYGDQDASCGSSYAAGKDNLRTSGSRNDVSFANCYSSGGRLVSTTDPALGGSAEVSYDALGRVTGVTGPRALALTWATDTTLADVTETGADGFVRSTFDTYGGSILDKTVTTDAGSTTLRYAGPFLLAVSGDAPTGLAATQYGLPGGATVTIDAGKQAVLDIAGADGSALATVAVPSLGAGSAAETGLAARFGSYGEPLVTPTDTSAIPSYTWKAMSRQETLPGTSSITLMGARPYHPWLGQFLAPDPNVDAGNNAYSYTNADPINQSDSSGREADALDWVARSLGAATFLLGLVGGGAAARIAMKGNILTGAKVAAWVGAVGAVTGVAATATQIVSMATSSSSVSWDQWVVSIGSGILSIVAVGGAVAGYRMYRAQKAWQQTVWNARNPVEAIRARTDPARELAYLPSKMKSGAKRHRQRFGVQFADQQSGGSLTQVNVVENMKSETFRNAYRKEDEAVFKFDSDSGIDNGRSLRNTRPDIFE